MFIGTIAPVETLTVDLEGHSLEEIHARAMSAMPPGFELVSAPVRMVKGSTALTAVATFARTDGRREVEADDREGLRSRVPDGWRLLSIRSL